MKPPFALALLVAASTAPAADAASARDTPEARARAAAEELGRTLRERLAEAMAAGGPAAAVGVCQAEARVLTTQVAERHGVRLGRAGTRLRNPANAPPPPVAARLEAWRGLPAASLAPVSHQEGGTTWWMVPLVVEKPCLACHGPPDAIDPAVKAALDALYPGDPATGYALGELRGILWAAAPSSP